MPCYVAVDVDKIIKKNIDFSLNNKHKIPSLSSSVTNPRQPIFINA